jgi:hypothetical protein
MTGTGSTKGIKTLREIKQESEEQSRVMLPSLAMMPSSNFQVAPFQSQVTKEQVYKLPTTIPMLEKVLSIQQSAQASDSKEPSARARLCTKPECLEIQESEA